VSGQNVAPVYDGYEVNPDGTHSMWLGYFNRNLEETLEVPIGPDNRFEPGPADRGQPTHFVPQWQKSSFRIVVPKDFGQQKLTWRLTSKGKTETVVASLDSGRGSGDIGARQRAARGRQVDDPGRLQRARRVRDPGGRRRRFPAGRDLLLLGEPGSARYGEVNMKRR